MDLQLCVPGNDVIRSWKSLH